MPLNRKHTRSNVHLRYNVSFSQQSCEYFFKSTDYYNDVGCGGVSGSSMTDPSLKQFPSANPPPPSPTTTTLYIRRFALTQAYTVLLTNVEYQRLTLLHCASVPPCSATLFTSLHRLVLHWGVNSLQLSAAAGGCRLILHVVRRSSWIARRGLRGSRRDIGLRRLPFSPSRPLPSYRFLSNALFFLFSVLALVYSPKRQHGSYRVLFF